MITLKPGSFMNNYFGLSTDEKPEDQHVPNASLFYEMDTGNLYMFDRENTTWIKQIGGSGGEDSGDDSGDIIIEPLYIEFDDNGSSTVTYGEAIDAIKSGRPVIGRYEWNDGNNMYEELFYTYSKDSDDYYNIQANYLYMDSTADLDAYVHRYSD